MQLVSVSVILVSSNSRTLTKLCVSSSSTTLAVYQTQLFISSIQLCLYVMLRSRADVASVFDYVISCILLNILVSPSSMSLLDAVFSEIPNMC